MADSVSHALASSATVKPTLNVEEEVVVIRNGWTPKKKKILVLYRLAILGNAGLVNLFVAYVSVSSGYV